MRNEPYKSCLIRSQPHKLADKKGGFTHAVNGYIEINEGYQVTNIMTEALNIPDFDWKHKSEEGADDVFVKYAKAYIDNRLR